MSEGGECLGCDGCWVDGDEIGMEGMGEVIDGVSNGFYEVFENRVVFLVCVRGLCL